MATLTNLNCFVLLDKSIRSSMKSNISDLVKYGIIILEDIEDLRPSDLIKTDKVVILGKYKFDNLWELKLYKEILHLDLYLITDDPIYKFIMNDLCKVYELDYTTVTSNLIYSVLYNDEAEQEKFKLPEDRLLPKENVENLLDTVNNDDTRLILEDYIRLRDILLEVTNTNNDLSKMLTEKTTEIIELKQDLDSITNSYDNLVKQVLEQRRVLKDAKIAFDMDFYEKINTSEYFNRPKILYFKEYQPMSYEDSFINTLLRMFKEQGNMSCKVVRLHDKYDLVRIKYLEDKYTLIDSAFRESDVINADKILSYGNYKKLMDMLLTNKSNLDLLIIYDCKKLNTLVLRDNFTYYNVCCNEVVAKKLGLKEGNTVCNDATHYPLSWDYLDKYYDFKNDNDRFRYLASTDVMTRIYKSIKSV